jgi:hypothetical protein
MQLCGWKADVMFRRYAIVTERDSEPPCPDLRGSSFPLERMSSF